MPSAFSRRPPLRLGGDRPIFAGLLVLLVLLPWPRGSNLAMAEAWLGLGVGLLLSAWAVQYLRGRLPTPTLPRSTHLATVLIVMWIAWTGAHLLPLPTSLLIQTNPETAGIHDALRAVGAEPFNTLGIAPAETVRQWLLTVTYGALYLLTVLVSASRKRQRIVLLTLVSVGLAQALYAIQLNFSGADWFGTGRSDGRASGSFVNPNHLAAYLELCLAAGLGLVLADLRGWRGGHWRQFMVEMIDLTFSTKFRVRVFLIAIVVALVLTQSRMGNSAFFISLCVCGSVYLLLRHRRWLGRGLLLFASVLLIDLWIVSDRFGLQRVVERIEQTDLKTEERPLVLADLEPVFKNHALLGAGLGSFEAAYAPYKDAAIVKRYDHAHNEYAQFLIETGAPGVLLLGLLAAVHAAQTLRIIARRRDPMRCGMAFAALMALTTMLIHAAAEFMLRIPSVSATLIVLLAMGARISSHGHTSAVKSVTDAPTGRMA